MILMAARPRREATYLKLAEAKAKIMKMSPSELVQHLVSLVKENEDWRGRSCINLLAPESLMSPIAKSLLSSELSERTAEGEIGDRWFSGLKYIDEVEALAVELAKTLFNSKYADHRLLSGMLGNLTVYFALTKPGDVIMSIKETDGGHVSNREGGCAGCRGLKVVDIPFNPYEMNIDVESFTELTLKVKPRLIALGSSLTLFPYPLREIREIADEVGAHIFYDGAHQLGLIAGGKFQDPLREGADVLTGSVGKTLSGPQRGLIVWNSDEIAEKLRLAIFPGLTAIHQINSVAAMAVTLAEMLVFGKDYAAQMVKNAKALGKALDEEGFDVLCKHKGYTETHQVAVDVSSLGGGEEAAKLLEQVNIICNKNLLPKDSLEDWDNPSGIRLGTSQVTRLGMKESEMRQIARFIRRVLIDKEETSIIAREVSEFRNSFQKVHYCFEPSI